ncbi:MAG: hypothetical protein KDC87_05500 [Planctomycetes bacterium]|nr:hypothetical protein [Planctomycetota bacterium]MCB9869615.1 hypothetical protein [Planctomycetota bacterium]
MQRSRCGLDLAQWLPCVLLVSCAATPTDPEVRAPWGSPPPALLRLPAGTVLRLLPASGSGTTLPEVQVGGLWRVAMQQSAHFDVASGVEDGPAAHALQLHADLPAQGPATWTTTLMREGQANLPVAAARGPRSAVGALLDELAWRTRAALGEDSAGLLAAPVSCTLAYSNDAACVRLTERGLGQLMDGKVAAAQGLLRQAREHDGACPVTLLHLAATLANRPTAADRTEAARIAREAIGYADRLTPVVGHQLARTFRLAIDDDAGLLELGLAYRRDRPHDPHGRYTEALAQVRLLHYDRALPLLENLRRRWPSNPMVCYQLAFARLARNDGEGALEALQAAGERLPRRALVRPRALALFHAGRHAELRKFLSGLRAEPGVAGTAAEHEVLRMQASHELLAGDRAAAIRLLTESLDWVRRRGSQLTAKTLAVAEDGEVLARLGATTELRHAVDGFLGLGQLPPAFANAVTFLGGLLDVQRGSDVRAALATLEKSTDSVWHSQLLAANHHRRGELRDEAAALQRAAQASGTALVHASYARVLATAGQQDLAQQWSTRVQQLLLSFDQRAPRDHPLMTPGRALAYLATKRD